MKPRSDAKLLNLPADQQDRICDWLLEGVETDEGRDTSYKKVCEQIFLDFGVKTSPSALQEFYRQVAAPRRLRRASVAADEFIGEAETEGAKFSAAAKRLAKQKFFEILASGNVDVRELKAFAAAVAAFDRGELERTRLQLQTQEFTLSREKFERDTCEMFLKWHADAKARAIAESNMSNADKIAALRAAYFADVDELEQSGAVQIPE